MKSNIPNDYNQHWHKCPVCGHRWHPAEEDCACEEVSDVETISTGDTVTWVCGGKSWVGKVTRAVQIGYNHNFTIISRDKTKGVPRGTKGVLYCTPDEDYGIKKVEDDDDE